MPKAPPSNAVGGECLKSLGSPISNKQRHRCAPTSAGPCAKCHKCEQIARTSRVQTETPGSGAAEPEMVPRRSCMARASIVARRSIARFAGSMWHRYTHGEERCFEPESRTSKHGLNLFPQKRPTTCTSYQTASSSNKCIDSNTMSLATRRQRQQRHEAIIARTRSSRNKNTVLMPTPKTKRVS